MTPYQAFTIGGGLGSVRGYGEGAVDSGRSCLDANNELTVPLVCKVHSSKLAASNVLHPVTNKTLQSIRHV